MSKIFVNSREVTINTFPGGEVDIICNVQCVTKADPVYVHAFIDNSDGVIALCQVKEYIDRVFTNNTSIILYLYYVPYARQDRVFKDRSFSLKVFANILNSLNFDLVIIADPHSDVTPALINNVRILSLFSFYKNIKNYDYIVAPDFGATKKIEQLKYPYIQGYKKRDPDTGELSGFGFYGDVKGKNLLIVDDICDGGGTFIGLTKELILKGKARNVDLQVTHGIFSKGIDILYQGGITNIFCTDSFINKDNYCTTRITKL